MENNNIHHLSQKQKNNQTPKKQPNNKLNLVTKIGATLAVPALLGHYVRKKNGDFNEFLAIVGIIASVGTSAIQNPDMFKSLSDTYLTEIELQPNNGLEQYIITRKENQVEVFNNNNPIIKENGWYSVGHSLTNFVTPIPLSTLVNKIQGNKPEIVTEIVGHFSMDVNDGKYTVNPKNFGFGNCTYKTNPNKDNYQITTFDNTDSHWIDEKKICQLALEDFLKEN